MDDIERTKKAHDFWQDTAIKQLSAANNWLLITSTGFLSFCIQKFEVVDLRFAWGNNIDWHLTCYVLSLMISLIAILAGVLLMISRLWDFRITRNIALTKYRFYQKVKTNKENLEKKFPTEPDERKSRYRLSRADVVLLVYGKQQKCDIKSENETEAHKKLKKLREFCRLLGEISWCLLKTQALALFLATSFLVMYYISTPNGIVITLLVIIILIVLYLIINAIWLIIKLLCCHFKLKK
jgi:hypothetical protein